MKETILVGDLILLRQQKLLGHLLRRDPDHMLRKPALNNDFEIPHIWHRCVGRPRGKWVEDALNHISRQYWETDFINTEPYRTFLTAAAHNHDF